MIKSVRSLAVFAILALSSAAFGQSNKSFMVSPEHCQMTAATTSFSAGPALVRAAANNLVLQGTTDTTAGTATVTCNIAVAMRYGSSAKITSVEVFYGVQTTAISSIAAATVSTVSMASPGAAAAGTVASAGGSLTVTPGTLQKTTTTTGQCFNERISFGTPIKLVDGQKLSIEQAFTTAGSTATVLQVCGVQVNYVDVP